MYRARSALLIWSLCIAMLAAFEAAGADFHVVRRGETLGHIAEHYGVRVGQLRQWNRIQGDRIVVGQRLALKAGAQPARVAARAKAKAPAVDPLKAQFDSWEKSVIARSKREGCYALVVNKAQRRMDVYLRGKHVASFTVALSYADRRNLADRQWPEDNHTKEGIFHLSEVAWSNRIAKWDRIWMRIHTVDWAKKDYVKCYGEKGRQRLGRWEAAHGRITTDQDVQAFNRANRGMTLWRGLGIHGGGAKYDWTEGCVALDRKDVRWLYNRLAGMPNHGVGTPLAVVRF